MKTPTSTPYECDLPIPSQSPYEVTVPLMYTPSAILLTVRIADRYSARQLLMHDGGVERQALDVITVVILASECRREKLIMIRPRNADYTLFPCRIPGRCEVRLRVSVGFHPMFVVVGDDDTV